MASAKEMLHRLKSVSKITTLREMVYDEIIKEEHTLMMLKEQDYLEGDIYGTGVLRKYKNQDYEIYKSKKNPLAGGAVDLINTGSFIDSFYLLKPKQNKYRFGATDSKKGELINNWGQGIMGLNQGVFEKFQIEIIKPRFVEKLRKIINKK